MPNIKRKKKAIRFRNTGDTPLAPSLQAGDRAVLLAVAREFLQVASDALSQLGVSRQDQQLAFRLATRGKKLNNRPAKRALERSYAVSDLLTHWQHDKRYTDQHGAPKVLPVNGKGVTLATLAKKFAPDMQVNEVLTAIVRHGEALRLKGDKVALLGTTLIVLPKTAELTLASITVGTQRLIRSILQNNLLPENQKNLGLVQRFVADKLDDAQFARWSREVRPELQKCIQSINARLRLAKSRSPKAKDSGVGIFVYRDE
ncbi:MAG TPA: DUF6502 family protein [Steroidobacteraceae bacterium]